MLRNDTRRSIDSSNTARRCVVLWRSRARARAPRTQFGHGGRRAWAWEDTLGILGKGGWMNIEIGSRRYQIVGWRCFMDPEGFTINGCSFQVCLDCFCLFQMFSEAGIEVKHGHIWNKALLLFVFIKYIEVCYKSRVRNPEDTVDVLTGRNLLLSCWYSNRSKEFIVPLTFHWCHL